MPKAKKKKLKNEEKPAKAKKTGIEKEPVIELKRKISELPGFWKVLIALLIAGLFIGAIVSLYLGLYLGITGMFFIVSIPLALYLHRERVRMEDIEKHFPDFLRDIAEYHNSGLPLSRSVIEAAKSDYGYLTPEVKKMAAEISWGVPFEDAIARLSSRIRSPFIKKAITIIVTAEEQGGAVTTILETLSEDLRKLKELDEERKGKLSIYTVTIYVIFLLLLMITVMLTATLAPAIPKMQVAGQFFSGATGGLTEEDFRTLLFHVSLIEAFFAGLISGQMGEGSVAAGLKHSIILVGITLLAFSFIPTTPPAEKIANAIIEIPAVEGFKGGQLAYKAEITETITSADIAEKVRTIAKERDMVAYKGFKEDDVVFKELICNQCAQGKATIEESAIKINEPVKLKFTVTYSGGRYVVELSDAE